MRGLEHRRSCLDACPGRHRGTAAPGVPWPAAGLRLCGEQPDGCCACRLGQGLAWPWLGTCTAVAAPLHLMKPPALLWEPETPVGSATLPEPPALLFLHFLRCVYIQTCSVEKVGRINLISKELMNKRDESRILNSNSPYFSLVSYRNRVYAETVKTESLHVGSPVPLDSFGEFASVGMVKGAGALKEFTFVKGS